MSDKVLSSCGGQTSPILPKPLVFSLTVAQEVRLANKINNTLNTSYIT